MKNDQEIFESLVAGGLIGAALGTLLSKNKEDGATLGALAGAAVLATFKANQQARKSSVPVLVEENGYIYEMHPDGSKKRIKKLEQPANKLPEHFQLS